MVADLDLVRLAAIRQAVEHHLGSLAGLQRIETPKARHGALMLDGADVKNVVYAPEERGCVVGRQLIALSEADELVCFQVYARRPERLDPLFRQFDRVLAAQLGVAVFDRSAAVPDYQIASILSHDWWDDGAWDLATPESAKRN